MTGFFEGWDAHPIRPGTPSGWVVLGGVLQNHEILDDVDGDRVFHYSQKGVTDTVMVWETPGSYQDGEIVARVRSDSTVGLQIGVIRQSNDLSLTFGLHAGARVYLRSIDSQGDGTVLGQMSIVWLVDTWYWLRMRCQGNVTQCRVWPGDQLEPTTWGVSYTGGLAEVGMWGLHTGNSAGNRRCAEIGMVTGTDTAPVFASELPTPVGLLFDQRPGQRKILSSWFAVPNAASYELNIEKLEGIDWVPVVTKTVSGVSTDLVESDGINWGTTYRARVRAMPSA